MSKITTNHSHNYAITLLGLGPGNSDLLTCQAWEWLQRISEIFLRTKQHPTVEDFPASIQVNSFDYLYKEDENINGVYKNIVHRVIELGERPQGVTYAVPGHPFVAEATCPEIISQAKLRGLKVRVIEGLSFLEPVYTALEIDPFQHLNLIDALELVGAYHPPFSPAEPALIAQIYSRQIASGVKLTLMAAYSDKHPVRMVHAAGTKQQIIEDLALFEIDHSEHIGLLTTLYLPSIGKDASFEALQEVIAHLRAPDGCPWDREQTHKSLRQHLLEETYEILSAIDVNDTEGMKEEFGDLLLQIVLHAQIAYEAGEFSMADILQKINRKLVHRHPHVFSNVSVDGTANVLRNWEKLKEIERNNKNDQNDKGLLYGVPKALPALAQAQEYQERAARVGFDWPEIQGVIDKIKEELKEVDEAKNQQERAAELGDLLFSVVNLARWYSIGAESALRETNLRFSKRFNYIEQHIRKMGRSLTDMTLKELDELWEKAKTLLS